MITYRPAEKEDSPKLAELINIASDGVVDYLFHDLIPGMTPVEVVAHNMENDHYPHSYKSAFVACDGIEVVGTALSYPSFYHNITDEMRSFFPADRIAHFSAFYSSRVENTWFLDALCVLENHRRRGIGGKLISLTKEKAVENGYHALSLIVFADNTMAIPVYLLEAINFDLALLDRSESMAEEMGRLYAEARNDRQACCPAKLNRDKIFTLPKEAVNEVRAYGQYVF